MTKTKLLFGSIALDLKRTALGFHRGSYETGERFLKEALDRTNEIDLPKTKIYMHRYIHEIKQLAKQDDKELLAEYALMYSVIIKNYATHFC